VPPTLLCKIVTKSITPDTFLLMPDRYFLHDSQTL
jgi:hypothetical protein